MPYLPAILWVLLSTALFTLIFAAAKFADGAMGTFQILFLRYLGAFAVLLVLSRTARHGGAWRSKRKPLHFLRAVCGCSAAAAITWSSAHMPIADATAISMLYGLITVILGAVFLREHTGAAIWGAVLLSLAGAAIVMLSQGAFGESLPVLPAAMALLGALLMACEGLLIRILARAESALTLMLYVTLFGCLLMLGPALAEWQAASITGIAACILLGPVSVAAQYCTIRGYRTAPLSVVGPVDYSWLIFAALLGFLAFGETPGQSVLAGGALIILGGIVLALTRHPPTANSGSAAHRSGSPCSADSRRGA